MSNEIQFEYSYQSDLLTLSEWGARQLGLNVLIEHPEQNGELHGVFLIADYLDLQGRLRRATPEKADRQRDLLPQRQGGEALVQGGGPPPLGGEPGPSRRGSSANSWTTTRSSFGWSSSGGWPNQDSLTRLNNHAAARRWIQMALAREDRSYAMVLFDLDNFKEANDRYGHMFGDEVLKHVRGSCRRACAAATSRRGSAGTSSSSSSNTAAGSSR